MNKLQYRTEGRYNLLGNEKSAQYVFKFREDAPKNLRNSFLIDLEKDGNYSGSALEIAYEIQSVFDDYWIHTGKDDIKAVVKYLEQWEEKDYYDGLKEEREKLLSRLAEVDKKLKSYDPDEWDNWNPEDSESTEQTQAESDQGGSHGTSNNNV